MKKTYDSIFKLSYLLGVIPNRHKGRSLKPSTSTSLLLMRVAVDAKIEEFEKKSQAALTKLKEDEEFKDFDKEAARMEQMRGVFDRLKAHEEWEGEEEKRPARPSDEEIEKAEEAKESEEKFNDMEAELTKRWNEARKALAQKEVTLEMQKLTRAELEDIVEVIGTEGMIELTRMDGVKYEHPRILLLADITRELA